MDSADEGPSGPSDTGDAEFEAGVTQGLKGDLLHDLVEVRARYLLTRQNRNDAAYVSGVTLPLDGGQAYFG